MEQGAYYRLFIWILGSVEVSNKISVVKQNLSIFDLVRLRMILYDVHPFFENYILV